MLRAEMSQALLQLTPLSHILTDPKGQCWVLHPACVESHKNRPRGIESRGSSMIRTWKCDLGHLVEPLSPDLYITLQLV